MPDVLSTATIVVALLLAAWALICAVVDRAPDRAQLIGVVLTTAVTAVLLVGSIVAWVGGPGPNEVVTWVGYGLTTAVLPYGGWVVGRMEPTRYGSLIVGVAALIVPVLVVRMGQVWGA
jgi:hypothetical protein